jgi:predicted amidohydrolase
VDRFIVASVQQKLRVPLTFDEYKEQLHRFLRAASVKRARLVVFPELAGNLLLPLLLDDFRSTLLKRADRGRRRSASLWQRMTGAMAGSAAGLLKASFQAGFGDLYTAAGSNIWQTYHQTFSALAAEFGVTLVAPSAYLPDPADNVIRNLAAVFGPGGELLGVQSKFLLSPIDETYCQPGSTWDVIHTEVGALGVILGSDVLFPEVGRLLAFQGAELFVMQGACQSMTAYNKLRAGALARMQDNQLFAASAYLVGVDQMTKTSQEHFVGKSAIFAPQELTPRFNGVLVEMGSHSSEGVLTAEWDMRALRQLWEESETPLRKSLALGQTSKMLASLYQRLQDTPRLADSAAAPDALPQLNLDELPVLASVTSRWPLRPAPTTDAAAETVADWPQRPTQPATPTTSEAPYEEETDEMDALANGQSRDG